MLLARTVLQGNSVMPRVVQIFENHYLIEFGSKLPTIHLLKRCMLKLVDFSRAALNFRWFNIDPKPCLSFLNLVGKCLLKYNVNNFYLKEVIGKCVSRMI